MKYDVAVLGSINVDIKAQISQYPEYGATATAKSVVTLPGGKGANQAIGVARLGGKLAFMGSVGQDASGQQMLQNLTNFRIDTKYIKQSPDAGTGSFIVWLDDDGENTMVGTLGANASLTAADIDRAMQEIEAPVLLLQMETSRESIMAALKQAQQKGMFVILDPAPADNYFEEALQYADCVTPNAQETQKISGVQVTDQQSALQAAKVIAAKGVPNVIVKMGSQGNLVYQNGKVDYVAAHKVQAVDTLGAGDTFAAGMAVSYAKNQDLLAAVEYGNKAAAIKVSRTGGQKSMPTAAEMQ
ncbi:ribokinase [Bombilactobacillus folatiphilus]|uniref:Ribokinase n=1 Tax=Bombilactobacillus folatiphilus TaxID=2923362 RepID=A0ABY4P927_9LACO|nr:ribokinase [Bombilactobacillus folatiphilus]UQS82228.1 ribokinase [Bombilactobacillus folatiphilus]